MTAGWSCLPLELHAAHASGQVCENAAKPSGFLMVKIGEMEKLDLMMLMGLRWFELFEPEDAAKL